MDYSLDNDQRELLSAVRTLLSRHAGAERAHTAAGVTGHRGAVLAALADAGFCDLITEGAGPLEAALVTEMTAEAFGTVAIGARSLVAPAVVGKSLPLVVALQGPDPDAPVRFGAQAGLVIGYDDSGVFTLDPDTAQVDPVPSAVGVPLATIRHGRRSRIGVPTDRLISWWQVALAAEMVGAMSAALRLTVDHLSSRTQFGRPLSSFQALRHRLAELHVGVEGARWLTRYAAFHHAAPEAAASAAFTTAITASEVVRDTHQLSGAIGLTREYDLHLATSRLAALRTECGGADAHAARLARARWAPGHAEPGRTTLFSRNAQTREETGT